MREIKRKAKKRKSFKPGACQRSTSLEQERKREEERSTGQKLNEKDEMAFRRKKAVK